MYRSRYDFASDYVDEDDVRAVVLKPKRRTIDLEALERPRRRAEPLDTRAERLIRQLRSQASLDYTAENFPHVVNRVAALWDDMHRLSDYIGKLMIDERGGRAGFPFEALDELSAVRALRLSQLTGKRDY